MLMTPNYNDNLFAWAYRLMVNFYEPKFIRKPNLYFELFKYPQNCFSSVKFT